MKNAKKWILPCICIAVFAVDAVLNGSSLIGGFCAVAALLASVALIVRYQKQHRAERDAEENRGGEDNE